METCPVFFAFIACSVKPGFISGHYGIITEFQSNCLFAKIAFKELGNLVKYPCNGDSRKRERGDTK